MSNIVPFEDDALTLPAHLQAAFGGLANSDLSGGVSTSYAILSYKGKTWALAEGDTREVIMRPDSDEAAQSLEVVIVSANPALSKVFYEGGYSEGSDAKPACYSNNGSHPEADAQKPQHSSCAACPRNVWGSRTTDSGAKGKACSDSRRLAVVPSGDLARLMLLRVPAATLKDLAAYADMLSRRQAPYSAVVTKIAFDPTVAHPKFTFKALRWLNAEEAEAIQQTMQLEVIGQITGTSSSRGAARQVVAQAAPAPEVEQAPAPTSQPSAAASAFGGKSPRAPAVTNPPAVKNTPAPAAPAKKAAPSFAAPAPAAKPEPAPSKASSKLAAASDELDAALADLDDI